MASGIDYSQAYQKAERAYVQGNYPEAAAVIDQLAGDYPDDPSVLLLRGHIYCYGLQRYDEAAVQYSAVLDLTSEPEYVDYASNGLEYANQFASSAPAVDYATDAGDTFFDEGASLAMGLDSVAASEADLSDSQLDLGEFSLDEESPRSVAQDGFSDGLADPFASDPFASDDEDPFGAVPGETSAGFRADSTEGSGWSGEQSGFDDITFDDDASFDSLEIADADDPFGGADDPYGSISLASQGFDQGWPPADDGGDDMTVFAPEQDLLAEEMDTAGDSAGDRDFYDDNGYGTDLDSDAQPSSNVDFLDEFSDFDDLGNLPDFELSDSSAGFTAPSVGTSGLSSTDDNSGYGGSAFDLSDMGDQGALSDDDIFSIAGATDSLPVFTQTDGHEVEAVATE